VPPVVRDYFPGGWHHHDREGRPVFLLRLGQMDVKGIVRSIGEEGLTKLTLHICEEGLRLSEESSHRLNKPITTWSMLLDLGNTVLSTVLNTVHLQEKFLNYQLTIVHCSGVWSFPFLKLGIFSPM
jgi:hypothetical protein